MMNDPLIGMLEYKIIMGSTYWEARWNMGIWGSYFDTGQFHMLSTSGPCRTQEKGAVLKPWVNTQFVLQA